MANNPQWATVGAAANRARAARAARVQADRAQQALVVLRDQRPAAGYVRRWIAVLEHRIAHPDATLAELSRSMTPAMTKDAYAAQLRRALRAGAPQAGGDGQ